MGLNSLKQLLKKNKTVDAVSRIICLPLFLIKEKKVCCEIEKRRAGKSDDRYEWIKELKGRYNNKRCFVVATGPSLTLEDLECIKNEFCFGMNSCIKAFGETTWRPAVYGIQDVYVYEKLKEELEAADPSDLANVWVSDSVANSFVTPERFRRFPLYDLDHKHYHRTGYGKFEFSCDCYASVNDGYSITFSLMQMAVYMGFKEIYLLGCDCNYNQPKTHFKDSGHVDPKAPVMGDKMIAGHAEFKKFADALGVNVINCTRGGMLEVYPRMNLDEVLGRDN